MKMGRLTLVVLASIFLLSDVRLEAQVNTNQAAPPGDPGNDVAGAMSTFPGAGQDTERRLAQLESQVSALRLELQRVKDNDLQQLNQQVSANGGNITQLGELVKSNAASIADLIKVANANKASLEVLVGQVDDNDKKLKQTVKQNAQGEFYLNYNMQIPEARRGFSEAVQSSGTAQIRLRIYNPGPYEHIIIINGARWRALVGESFVWVPFGRVAVSNITNVTPPSKMVSEDDWNPAEREYQMFYDLRKPWP